MPLPALVGIGLLLAQIFEVLVKLFRIAAVTYRRVRILPFISGIIAAVVIWLQVKETYNTQFISLLTDFINNASSVGSGSGGISGPSILCWMSAFGAINGLKIVLTALISGLAMAVANVLSCLAFEVADALLSAAAEATK